MISVAHCGAAPDSLVSLPERLRVSALTFLLLIEERLSGSKTESGR